MLLIVTFHAFIMLKGNDHKATLETDCSFEADDTVYLKEDVVILDSIRYLQFFKLFLNVFFSLTSTQDVTLCAEDAEKNDAAEEHYRRHLLVRKISSECRQ